MRYSRQLLLAGGLAAVTGLAGCGAIKETMETKEAQAGQGVSVHGALSVSGTVLTDGQGGPVVLRGTSSHGITWYPRYLNGSAMKTLAEHGANVQRIAMYTEPKNAYIENPVQSLNYLYMGIESALAADMYVIVDWHILKDNNPNEYADEAEQFFDELSSRYGGNPAILYEICNEPNGDTEWEDIVRYANRIIPVIRANAPDAVILVGTPNYCTDFTGPLENPLEFDNIMYTMHRYIDVTEDKPCDTKHIESVVERGLPIFVSEWGTSAGEQTYLETGEYKSDTVTYQKNAQPFIDYMKNHQISWTAWALGNKDEAHSMIRSDCDKYSGWMQDELTEFGRLIFSNFK